jgi:hypothetical protein
MNSTQEFQSCRDFSNLEAEKLTIKQAFRNAASVFGLKLGRVSENGIDKYVKSPDSNETFINSSRLESRSGSCESIKTKSAFPNARHSFNKIGHFKWVKNSESKWIPIDQVPETLVDEQGDGPQNDSAYGLKRAETNTNVSIYSKKSLDYTCITKTTTQKCPSDSFITKSSSVISIERTNQNSDESTSSFMSSYLPSLISSSSNVHDDVTTISKDFSSSFSCGSSGLDTLFSESNLSFERK